MVVAPVPPVGAIGGLTTDGWPPPAVAAPGETGTTFVTPGCPVPAAAEVPGLFGLVGSAPGVPEPAFAAPRGLAASGTSLAALVAPSAPGSSGLGNCGARSAAIPGVYGTSGASTPGVVVGVVIAGAAPGSKKPGGRRTAGPPGGRSTDGPGRVRDRCNCWSTVLGRPLLPGKSSGSICAQASLATPNRNPATSAAAVNCPFLFTVPFPRKNEPSCRFALHPGDGAARLRRFDYTPGTTAMHLLRCGMDSRQTCVGCPCLASRNNRRVGR
jgi:hypothetical protein